MPPLFLIGFLHGFFLVSLLVLKGKTKTNENYFLALFLAIISGYLAEQYIISEGYIYNFPHILAAFVPLFYALGPLYFLYVRSSSGDAIKIIDYRILIHFVPSIICFFILLPVYFQSGEYKLSLLNFSPTGNFELIFHLW